VFVPQPRPGAAAAEEEDPVERVAVALLDLLGLAITITSRRRGASLFFFSWFSFPFHSLFFGHMRPG
jgi:hypothetical protein